MTPAWAASYVIALANSTGWPEHFILWELPMARGWLYMHAILSMNGATLAPAAGVLKNRMADIAATL